MTSHVLKIKVLNFKQTFIRAKKLLDFIELVNVMLKSTIFAIYIKFKISLSAFDFSST